MSTPMYMATAEVAAGSLEGVRGEGGWEVGGADGGSSDGTYDTVSQGLLMFQKQPRTAVPDGPVYTGVSLVGLFRRSL